MNVNNRKNKRTPCNEEIKFVMSTTDGRDDKTITATVVDISATGLGIAIDIMLKKDQPLQFDQTQPKWSLPEQGVVVWSFKGSAGYRAGLEFIV